MDIPWGSDPARKFITNVGLITTEGPHGSNVMACEWTHHISYEPGIILISMDREHTTVENIRTSKEYGVSLAAENQNIIASVAGGFHGRDVDKLGILKELGVEFYTARNIKVLMIKGAVLNAECKVIEIKEMGTQVMFLGEVVDLQTSDQAPLLYHGGKYHKVGKYVRKPPDDVLDNIKSFAEKHRK